MNHIEKTTNQAIAKASGGALIAKNRLRFDKWEEALDCEETMGQLFELLRQGNYIETAVLSVGIPKHVWKTWNLKGTADKAEGRDTVFATFLDALDAVSAASEAQMVRLIRESADRKEKLPVGYCWLLERVRGNRFKQNVPSGAAQDVNVQVNVLGVAAPAPDTDYKTWLENKQATDKALAGRTPIEVAPLEVPDGIESVTVQTS
tara:strand:+ start:301 stop:915 length:615 start_codon:yes stop_codon:yes gene_type:complete